MPGHFVFDPDDKDVGFSLGEDQAAGVYHDIENDALYLTDLTNIIQWEGATPTNQIYTWKSAKIRLPREINLGGAMVEAESYDSLIFKLYADGSLVTSISVTDDDPFRLPGGYLSNLYQVEIISTDRVTAVTTGANIFDLAGG